MAYKRHYLKEYRTKQELWNIALHEAAHAVVAYKLGKKVKHISITPEDMGDGEASGWCAYFPSKNKDDYVASLVGTIAGIVYETGGKPFIDFIREEKEFPWLIGTDEPCDWGTIIWEYNKIKEAEKEQGLPVSKGSIILQSYILADRIMKKNKRLIRKVARTLLEKKYLRSKQFLAVVEG